MLCGVAGSSGRLLKTQPPISRRGLHGSSPIRGCLFPPLRMRRTLPTSFEARPRIRRPKHRPLKQSLTMVPYVLPLAMVEVREYLDGSGRSPHALGLIVSTEKRQPRWRLLWHACNRAICPTPRALEPVFMSTGLILVRATGFTLAKMATGWVILVGGGTKKRQQEDIKTALAGGKTTNNEKRQEGDYNGFDTRFQGTIRARVKRDPGFRKALLREGIENFLSGDVETGKIILRDFINATVGFTKLSDVTHCSAKSLMRMLGPSGTSGSQLV